MFSSYEEREFQQQQKDRNENNGVDADIDDVTTEICRIMLILYLNSMMTNDKCERRSTVVLSLIQ